MWASPAQSLTQSWQWLWSVLQLRLEMIHTREPQLWRVFRFMQETVQTFSDLSEDRRLRCSPICRRSPARCPSTVQWALRCSGGSCRWAVDSGGWSSRWWGSSWAGASVGTRRGRVCGSAGLWWPRPPWTTPVYGLCWRSLPRPPVFLWRSTHTRTSGASDPGFAQTHRADVPACPSHRPPQTPLALRRHTAPLLAPSLLRGRSTGPGADCCWPAKPPPHARSWSTDTPLSSWSLLRRTSWSGSVWASLWIFPSEKNRQKKKHTHTQEGWSNELTAEPPHRCRCFSPHPSVTHRRVFWRGYPGFNVLTQAPDGTCDLRSTVTMCSPAQTDLK